MAQKNNEEMNQLPQNNVTIASHIQVILSRKVYDEICIKKITQNEKRFN